MIGVLEDGEFPPLLKFALIVTAMVGVLVFVLAMGLIAQKVAYEMRSARNARLDEYYRQKIDPILLEDLPPESMTPDSLPFRQYVKRLCEPLIAELESKGKLSRRAHRAALKRVMLVISRDLVGESRARLSLAFLTFGFAQEELRDLGSHRWWVRAKACRNLALMRAEDATADLVILLADDEEDVRIEAAMALVTIAGINALRDLLTKLPKISVWMSIQLSKVILSMGSAAVPDLVEALTSDLPTIVGFSIEMLGKIEDPTACGPLVEFARTTDTNELRCKALRAIGILGDEAGEEVLLEYLADDDQAVRISAAEGLGSLTSPETIPLLKHHLLHDSKKRVRLAAGRALTRINGAGKDFFIGVYGEADTVTKMIVLESLEELGVPEETIRRIAQ
jgi:HEAT repeat protein